MEDLKFKDVMHHYMDCKVYIDHPHAAFNIDALDADLYLCLVTGRVPIEHYKPLLYPLSAITEDQRKVFKKLNGSSGFPARLTLFYTDEILWLLRNHFNVFNLPESEYIDASKLPVNPYSKP